MFIYKVLLAIQNIKMLYHDENIIVGYSIKKQKYRIFTVADHKLIYFDEATSSDEVKMKIQVLKGV